VFFPYTPIKAKEKEKREEKTRRMGGNAVRVDLIWDDGERAEKGGKKKSLEGRRSWGKRIDGLKRTRIEPCLEKEKGKTNNKRQAGHIVYYYTNQKKKLRFVS
jgi:hypothetical protein